MPGTPIQKLSGLFPRIVAAKDTVSLGGKEAATVAKAPRIKIDEFGKIELRVAEVVAAEPLPRSKKLLKLTVSLGEEQRTLVAGIAEHYTPAELVGKKVVVVANLEPAKLMGVESNGMVLAASSAGKLAVLTPDRDLPPGPKVTWRAYARHDADPRRVRPSARADRRARRLPRAGPARD